MGTLKIYKSIKLRRKNILNEENVIQNFKKLLNKILK